MPRHSLASFKECLPAGEERDRLQSLADDYERESQYVVLRIKMNFPLIFRMHFHNKIVRISPTFDGLESDSVFLLYGVALLSEGFGLAECRVEPLSEAAVLELRSRKYMAHSQHLLHSDHVSDPLWNLPCDHS